MVAGLAVNMVQPLVLMVEVVEGVAQQSAHMVICIAAHPEVLRVMVMEIAAAMVTEIMVATAILVGVAAVQVRLGWTVFTTPALVPVALLPAILHIIGLGTHREMVETD